MSFPDAVRTCLTTKYAAWQGRAGRAEYWWFTLFYLIAYLVVAIIGAAIGFRWLVVLVVLALLLPGICVGIRRLHDTNRTGWWLLIDLIPIVGTIVLLVFFIQQGTPGPNNYGPPPQTAAPAQGGQPIGY